MDVPIFLLLIVLSALFAASETALFSLRSSEVRLMEKSGARNAHIVAKLKNDPHRLLLTIISANTLLNILVGSFVTFVAINHTQSFSVGVATGISTIILLLFGEIFPKSLAVAHNKRVAQIVAYPIYYCYLVFYPIASGFVRLQEQIRGGNTTTKPGLVSEEEIRAMAELGLEHGEIDRRELEMIEKIFTFDDIPVGAIMTKKEAIDSLNGEVPVTQIAYYVSQSGFSRFPVHEGNQNDYVGYVHTNDVMRVLNSDAREEPLVRFMSPLTRIDESLNIEYVFRLMTKERSHLYLVHKKDSPEDVVGLVTMEDILEEIMGEIEDEGDKRAHRERKTRYNSEV